MYLSRVEIDKNNRLLMRNLTHLGAYHDWVEQAFPEEFTSGVRSRKLWRIDRIAGRSYLLLVSETKPDKEQLERYGVAGSAASRDYDPFLKRIHKGDSYRFRVTLNPVHAVLEEGKKRGRIYPLYAEEDQLQFFLSKSDKFGFHVDNNQIMIVEKGQEDLKKKGERNIHFVKVVYEGQLLVDDEEKLINLLTHGMGREKAYGFGLMTLIKVL